MGKISKILSYKDKEINCLKNHSHILRKKLKLNDISIMKVDKETTMDASETRKFWKLRL